MIKKIFPAESDLYNLSLKRVLVPASVSKMDYKGLVVDKPWGYEYLIFENDKIAIWILFLKHLANTSMHCHPKKKTSLLVLSGRVNTAFLNTSFSLKTMDGLIIDRGVFHSTKALSEGGAFIMEIETPPEKSDLVRLKDEYGRENQGYEGIDKTSKDLGKYEYVDFHQDPAKERQMAEKIVKDKKVILHEQENWENLKVEIKQRDFCVISFLDAEVVDLNNRTVLEVGEVCEGKWFLENSHKFLPLENSFNLLSIH